VRFASVEDVPLTAASMDLRATFPNDLKYELAEGASSAMEAMTYTVIVESSAPRDEVVRLLRRAEANCHAAQSLRVPVRVVPALRLNGEEISLGHA
jgi:hypothetical protein